MRRQPSYLAYLAAAIAAGLALRWFLDPMRVPVPDRGADVRGIARPLSRLPADERALVIGYLLRKRGETPSTFMRDDAAFPARNFREAIAAQRQFLQRENYASSAAFLRIGARDTLLAPLRAAVFADLYRRELRTKNAVTGIEPGKDMRLGAESAGEGDAPVLVVIYRIRNRTHEDIEKVTGIIQIRHARFDRSKTDGIITSCGVDIDALRAGEERLFACANADKPLTTEDALFLKAGPGDLHVTWSPGSVRFAGGRTLTYDPEAVERTRIWGQYPVSEAAR